MAKQPRVYFVDGLGIERDYFTVVAFLHELEDEPEEFSRIYFCDAGDWTHFETETQIVSVDQAPIANVRTYFFLARRGEVIVSDKNGQRRELIAGPGTGKGKLGYVTEIKNIAGQLYACGDNRQVYRREKDVWVPIHDQILMKQSGRMRSSFQSISGTGPTNIFAVGNQGEMFHFDGKNWDAIDSPTNSHLQRVICVSPHLVYACGYNGVFLRGQDNDWEVFSQDNVTEELWGLTVFQDIPYVAHTEGILRFDGTALVPVDTKLQPPPDTSRLCVADGCLWSFGIHDICRFDGKRWNRFVCPDNA